MNRFVAIFYLIVAKTCYFHVTGNIDASKIKVIDVIFSSDGDNLIKLHINNLMDVVDLFVLAESKSSIAGMQNSDIDFLKSLESSGKLLKFTVDDVEQHQTNSRSEGYLCDFALTKVKEVMADQIYVILSGNTNELVDRTAVKVAVERYDELSLAPLYFGLINFMYSFKWYKTEPAQKSFAINNIYLSKHPNMSLEKIRNDVNPDRMIYADSGWRCSYFERPDQLAAKFKKSVSISNISAAPPAFQLTSEWIRNCMQQGVDMFNRTSEGDVLHKYDGRIGYPVCKKIVWSSVYLLV